MKAEFKVGDLVKVIRSYHSERQGKFAIVASEYYQNNTGLWVDVMIGEKTHPIRPASLEKVNAK